MQRGLSVKLLKSKPVVVLQKIEGFDDIKKYLESKFAELIVDDSIRDAMQRAHQINVEKSPNSKGPASLSSSISLKINRTDDGTLTCHKRKPSLEVNQEEIITYSKLESNSGTAGCSSNGLLISSTESLNKRTHKKDKKHKMKRKSNKKSEKHSSSGKSGHSSSKHPSSSSSGRKESLKENNVNFPTSTNLELIKGNLKIHLDSTDEKDSISDFAVVLIEDENRCDLPRSDSAERMNETTKSATFTETDAAYQRAEKFLQQKNDMYKVAAKHLDEARNKYKKLLEHLNKLKTEIATIKLKLISIKEEHKKTYLRSIDVEDELIKIKTCKKFKVNERKRQEFIAPGDGGIFEDLNPNT